jgi:N-acetylmuramoyl-L-alanine amidase CwlA
MDKEIKSIDINLNEVKSKGVAYYRLTKEMKEFFEKCLEESDIVGFEWEKGSFNFGVILADK